jgi:hypothetical protein
METVSLAEPGSLKRCGGAHVMVRLRLCFPEEARIISRIIKLEAGSPLLEF